MFVYGLRQRPVDALHRGQIRSTCPRHRFRRSQGAEQGPLAVWPAPLNVVERIGADALAPSGAMAADRKAMRLVAQSLNVIEHGIAPIQHEGRPPGLVETFPP